MIPHSSAVCSSRWESYHRKSYQKTSVIFLLPLKPSDEGRCSMPSTLRAKPLLNFSFGLCYQLHVWMSAESQSCSGSSHNWIMWPWLFCFSPNPHLWWIPTWLAPNLALQAAPDPAPCLWGVALVTPQTLKPLCDFKPLSREKNKGSCSNQAPNQEQLLHSDYRYLSGTQETLSEWASTE